MCKVHSSLLSVGEKKSWSNSSNTLVICDFSFFWIGQKNYIKEITICIKSTK